MQPEPLFTCAAIQQSFELGPLLHDPQLLPPTHSRLPPPRVQQGASAPQLLQGGVDVTEHVSPTMNVGRVVGAPVGVDVGVLVGVDVGVYRQGRKKTIK